jgi:hypothetical protein
MKQWSCWHSFCYKEITWNRITRAVSPIGKFWKCSYFFTVYRNFFILLTMRVTTRPLAVSRDYKFKPILDHLNVKFRSVYTPQCDVPLDESLRMWKRRLSWKVYIPSKRARFDIKSWLVWSMFHQRSSNVSSGIIVLVMIFIVCSHRCSRS